MEEEQGFLTFFLCFMPLKEAEEKPEQSVIRAGEPGWELDAQISCFLHCSLSAHSILRSLILEAAGARPRCAL